MAYPSNASKKQSQFLSTDTIPGSAYFGLWDNDDTTDIIVTDMVLRIN